jgi:hypothetical protein
LGLELVVDAQRDQPPSMGLRPGLGRQQQGDGIPAAGEGERDRTRAVGEQAPIENGLGLGG